MALATRELELVLIAKDNASAILARVGGAFVVLGGIITRVGAQGIEELAQMTQEAIDFRQQIAYAVTQIDKDLGASIEDVAAISRSVGSQIPIPFEELNSTLYDIFSTLDLDRLSQAKDLLGAFATSAVAGQAPLEDIGRSVIAWMNALDMAPTLQNANRLLDIQFELVRLGAGTYGEFSGEVGKSIPAFAAASQEVETFAGVMAFLTRNGLSASMAATSAARAVELMFDPKAIKNMKKMGIQLLDNNGNFLQMNDILRQLMPTFEGLDDAERKIKFKEIFGTGRIQARRFFDVAIPNFEELDRLINQMGESTGSVMDAFRLMMEQPQSQIDLFRNQWALLRQEVGDRFIPLLQKYLFPALATLFDWWNELDPVMKDHIVRWGGIGLAILTAFGALMTLYGGFILLKGLLGAGGLSLGGFFLGFGKFLGLLGLIAGAVYLIWTNWDKIRELWDRLYPTFRKVWDKIWDVIKNFIKDNEHIWKRWWQKLQGIWEKAQELWNIIWEGIQDLAPGVVDFLLGLWEEWGDKLFGVVGFAWDRIVTVVDTTLDIISGILDFWIAVFTGDWEGAWNALVGIAGNVTELIFGNLTSVFLRIVGLIESWGPMILGAWNWIWEQVGSWFSSIWEGIVKTISGAWSSVVDFFTEAWDDIPKSADGMWEDKLKPWIKELPGKIWDAAIELTTILIERGGELLGGLLRGATSQWVNTIFPWFSGLPQRVLSAIPSVVSTLWSIGWGLLNGLITGAKWMWDNIIYNYLFGIPTKALKAIPSVVSTLWSVGWTLLSGLWNGLLEMWDIVKFWLTDLPRKIISAIGSLASSLFNAGKDAINGLWNGMKDKWKSVSSWLKGLTTIIGWLKGPPGKDKVLLLGAGQLVMQGFNEGLMKGWMEVEKTLGGITGSVNPTFQQGVASGVPAAIPVQPSSSEQTNIEINVKSGATAQEIIDELSWQLRMR